MKPSLVDTSLQFRGAIFAEIEPLYNGHRSMLTIFEASVQNNAHYEGFFINVHFPRAKMYEQRSNNEHWPVFLSVNTLQTLTKHVYFLENLCFKKTPSLYLVTTRDCHINSADSVLP